MSLFFLYASFLGVFEGYVHRTIFLSFSLFLTFLINPISKRHEKSFVLNLLNLIMIILTVLIGIYSVMEHYNMLLRVGNPSNIDLFFGGILIILVLEATRRSIGYPLVILAIIFIIYAYFGIYFPRMIAHGGYELAEIIEINFMTTSGIFSIMLGVTAEFIILFTIFGGFLTEAGAVDYYSEIALSLTGHKTGGPAKAAVLASALMGTLSGSSAANVVTTGSFTIPLMKRIGYPARFAGAVEACASTGGQFMPPIMGAAAFVIAATIGIPYFAVVKATIIPASLYFLSVGFTVHLMSKKLNFGGLPKEELPTFGKAFKEGGILLIPILVIVGILAMGYSPSLAGFSAVVTIVIVVMLKKKTRLSPQKILKALERGGVSVLGVANACACAGIVVSSIAMTGLGMRISSIVAYVGQASIYIALIYTMIASLILGMGMPTVAAYIVVATLGTPALVNLGIPVLAAHIFVFFYAIICNVTPPVALAAYAAAPIAGEDTNAFEIGLSAFIYAISAFIIPFVFVFNQTLLMEGNISLILLRIIICIIGMFALSLATTGYYYRQLSIIERVLVFCAAIILIHPGLSSSLVGFLLLVTILLRQREYIPYFRKEKKPI